MRALKKKGIYFCLKQLNQGVQHFSRITQGEGLTDNTSDPDRLLIGETDETEIDENVSDEDEDDYEVDDDLLNQFVLD